jgi:hypothetical protein
MVQINAPSIAHCHSNQYVHTVWDLRERTSRNVDTQPFALFIVAAAIGYFYQESIARPSVKAPRSDEQVIRISAKTFEFLPSEITAKKGIPVTLELVSADRHLEAAVLGTALHAAVARRAPAGVNPVVPSEENLIQGARLYKQAPKCSRNTTAYPKPDCEARRSTASWSFLQHGCHH